MAEMLVMFYYGGMLVWFCFGFFFVNSQNLFSNGRLWSIQLWSFPPWGSVYSEDSLPIIRDRNCYK